AVGLRPGRPPVEAPARPGLSDRRARASRTAFLLALAVAMAGCKGRPQAARGAAEIRPCRSSADCARGDYCSHPDGRCGQGPAPGACRPRPGACTGARAPAGPCDGRAYDTECLAHAGGADLSVSGGCQALVPDWIACGR